METYIYTLSDSSGIRYIGKSDFPCKRFKMHIKESKLRRTRKEKWMDTLLKNGGKIEMEIIDVVDILDWSFFESYWISQLKAWGFDILNGTDGGEGSNGFKGKSHSTETKEKLRKLATGRIPTNETREKISDSNRKRIVSESTKEKISQKAKNRSFLNREEINRKISESVKKYHDKVKKKENL